MNGFDLWEQIDENQIYDLSAFYIFGGCRGGGESSMLT